MPTAAIPGGGSQPPAAPVRLPSIDALTDPGALARILGAVASIERSPLITLGYTYTGNRLERLEARLASGVRQRLVLKHVAPDWVAGRSGDRAGREAALLAQPALAGVWEAFACPYLAFATRGGESGLLMDDLSAHLLPDVDEPLTEAEEDAILAALAALHARYWDAEVLRLAWLTTPAARFALLGPPAAEEVDRWPTPPGFFAAIRQGWGLARRRLPLPVWDRLARPPEVLAEACVGLPATLLHGDAKVANFALLPGGRVAAFDWQLLGSGPATLDLGWYLAVNAGRLARPKEAVLARYRGLLEARLAGPLADTLWDRLVAVGVLCGALMLLWAKALALEGSGPSAAAEWDWWVARLQEMPGP